MEHVVVVGAGLMGAQIGVEYALGGHDVALHARDVSAVAERVKRAEAAASDFELAGPGEIEAAFERIRITSDLEEIEHADLVVESLPEDLGLKRDVLAPLAARFADATFASNTSSLRISDLGTAIDAPERTLGTHYWNPPLLMPLVELVPGADTAPDRIDRIEALLCALGKRPVRVLDVPGFAWNRLQFALLREALWLVRNQVATAEDVEEIVRSGLARRWRLIGPFATLALGGPSTFERVADNLFPLLSADTEAGDLTRFAVSAEEADRIRAFRDRGLAAELGRDEGP
jgi:3-hydroxybutyryl-CoA dehydrogenase